MTGRVKLDTDWESAIVAACAVRGSIENTDGFRVMTAEKPEFGIRMNTVSEWNIVTKFPFLGHVAAMTAAHPDLNGDATVRENQELFDKLCQSRAKHRWYDSGHWRALCREAKRQGLTGADEAMAAQEQDELRAKEAA